MATDVHLSYKLGPRLVLGHFGNTDRAALAWGPFMLAYDQARNPELPPASAIGLVRESTELTLQPGPSLAFRGPSSAARAIACKAGCPCPVRRRRLNRWQLPRLAARSRRELCRYGVGPGRWPESRTRQGNQNGSIIDGDPSSFVVTFDGSAAKEDWYAVTLPASAKIARVVFKHGQNFHDGGWFDTRGGKPKCRFNGPLEVRGRRSASWADIRPRRPPTAAISRTGRRLNVVWAARSQRWQSGCSACPPAETTRTRNSRRALSSKRSLNEPRPSF